MVLEQTEEWLSITLKEPYLLVGGSTQSQPQPILEGSVIVTVSKATKVRWLRLCFIGLVRSAFSFDSSRIPAATPCEPCDKFNFGCKILEIQCQLLSNEFKEPHVLSAGTHSFPFSIPIADHLPSALSSGAINVNYQVVASLQLISFIPFSQPYLVTQPVILVHHDPNPDDAFYRTGAIHLISKRTRRLTGRVTSPCLVFPQGGMIPMMIHLNLQGHNTSVNKVVIELWESVFQLSPTNPNPSDRNADIHLDERLVTRQICPIVGWPSSVGGSDEPTVIAKRLLFKTPEGPLKPWSEEKDEISLQDRRSNLPKGFCHSSGLYPQINTRIEHTLRVVVYLEGQLPESAEPTTMEEDTAEQDVKVCIVGFHQSEGGRSDDTLPPSYHRSFTNVLVEGVKLAEMDRMSIEALQQDLSLVMTDSSTTPTSAGLLEPPCYEESISSTSSSSGTRIGTGWEQGFECGCASSDVSPSNNSSARPSMDTFAYDLAAYTERYSFANQQS